MTLMSSNLHTARDILSVIKSIASQVPCYFVLILPLTKNHVDEFLPELDLRISMSHFILEN